MRVDVGKTALSPQAGIEDNSKESFRQEVYSIFGSSRAFAAGTGVGPGKGSSISLSIGDGSLASLRCSSSHLSMSSLEVNGRFPRISIMSSLQEADEWAA